MLLEFSLKFSEDAHAGSVAAMGLPVVVLIRYTGNAPIWHEVLQ